MRKQEVNRKLFNRAHYNILAKQIKLKLEPAHAAAQYYASAPEESFQRRASSGLVAVENPKTQYEKAQLQVAALVDLALALANRLALDNEGFDPLIFLDACSPDPENYPLSELWTGLDDSEVDK